MINWIKKAKIKRKSDVLYTMVNPHVDSAPVQSYPNRTYGENPQENKTRYRQEKRWLLEEDGTQISTNKHVEEKDGKYYAYFKKKIHKEFPNKEEAEEYLSKQSNLRFIGQLDPIIIDGYMADIKGEFLKQFSEKGVENTNTFDIVDAFQKEKKIDPEVMAEIMKRLLENGDILEETFEKWRAETYGEKKEDKKEEEE